MMAFSICFVALYNCSRQPARSERTILKKIAGSPVQSCPSSYSLLHDVGAERRPQHIDSLVEQCSLRKCPGHVHVLLSRLWYVIDVLPQTPRRGCKLAALGSRSPLSGGNNAKPLDLSTCTPRDAPRQFR